ncbi:DUF2929 family protein [Pseudogracilibacillus sp. SO10305]|uniref:DUF2929 family protein n=1 Tax=Pseudogracilibacillus sp. SO10305 TaxID=3098292 RepID=UPI00300E38D9
MRVIVAFIWAVLISSALAYILSSMANEMFNFTQALGLSISMIVAVMIIDGILSSFTKSVE